LVRYTLRRRHYARLNTEMNSSSVSVIIPAFQAADTISRTLKSIVTQTVAPTEVIVVDDGSNDGTAEATEAMRDQMGDIDLIFIQQNHEGAGAARNQALKEASFDYVAFLDADDEWLPEKLERSLEVLNSTESILVSHDYIRREADGSEFVVLECSKNFNYGGDPYVRLYRQGYIATSGVVARRDAVLAAGGFDESLPTAQDFALWLSMLSEKGTKFEIFPGPLLRYHVTAGSISTYTERRLNCTLNIARQYFPTLISRSRFPLASLWYRIFAIHYEALSAYLTQRRIWSAMSVIIRTPLNIIKLTFASKFIEK
jgi:glycosyltransferase involved in cell wall biosynthesis